MISLGNHEIELQFTMPVWEKIEEQVGLIDDFDNIMNSRGRLRKVALMTAIMNVRQPCSAEEIYRLMEPSDVRIMVAEIRRVIGRGLKMNTKKDEDKVVDEVLEELEKKETRAE